MIIAQCDAVISLVDDEYYTRAWCSVEVMMVQRLRESYHRHIWYEHVLEESNGIREENCINGHLREGPMDMKIIMSEKKLRFEEDRSKVLFLERQSKLLG